MADPWAGCRNRRERPWPLQPLLDATKWTATEVGRQCGTSGATVRRAIVDGLTDQQADWWACRCGLHPAMVWPGWVEAGLTPSDDVFVNGGPGLVPGWRQAYEWAENQAVTSASSTHVRATMGGYNEDEPRGAWQPSRDSSDGHRRSAMNDHSHALALVHAS